LKSFVKGWLPTFGNAEDERPSIEPDGTAFSYVLSSRGKEVVRHPRTAAADPPPPPIRCCRRL